MRNRIMCIVLAELEELKGKYRYTVCVCVCVLGTCEELELFLCYVIFVSQNFT